MKPELVLVGGGGHCASCIDVIEREGQFVIAGIVDRPEKIGRTVLGYPMIGDDGNFQALTRKYRYFFITLGQIKNSQRRAQLFAELKKIGVRLPVIISPLAYVSPHAQIGEGTIVMHRALVNANASIGSNCIINSLALVEHDAVIDSHCHISTGAIVNGGTRVKEHTFVGSQAMLREGIEIGAYSIIGAGMCILRDVAPASIIKKP